MFTIGELIIILAITMLWFIFIIELCEKYKQANIKKDIVKPEYNLKNTHQN